MSLRLRFSALSALSGIAIGAFVLAGCGARARPVSAPTQEPDYDWGQFKGKDAPAEPSKEASTDKQPTKESTREKSETPKGDSSDKKSASKTEIGGHSVSEVSADDVAAATKRATKRAVVSTNVVIGAEYEQVNVVLDKGAVQIIRPATSPDKSGPKVRSPKARNDDMGETDAAFYDAKADVLVIVQAGKKASSKKALAALVGGTSAAPAKKPVRGPKRKRT